MARLSRSRQGHWARVLDWADGDVLLVVDVLDDFSHEHGAELLASFRERHSELVALLGAARLREVPVVYANDNKGIWDGNGRRLVDAALGGAGGDAMLAVAPRSGDRFVVKPRYSAFDHTALDLILEELGCQRLLVAGMTTEGCVTQSAIAARELGMKVTVFPAACATISPRAEETALRYLADVVGVMLDDPPLPASMRPSEESDVSAIPDPRELFPT